MTSFRPRFSLLTAFLVTAIVAMGLGLWQLYSELVLLRMKVRRLYEETGQLSIEDESDVHVMQVRTNDDLTWKWRVWVPKGEILRVHLTWGDVPADELAVPQPAATCHLGSGEQWVTLRVLRVRNTDKWQARIELPPSGNVGSGDTIIIPEDQQWFDWPRPRREEGGGIGFRTIPMHSSQRTMILKRLRVTNRSSEAGEGDGPTSGFILWLERK